MNKEQYIMELKEKLRGVNEEDMEDALSYCEEYFEDAGVENEQTVIDELGTPSKYAAQIKAEFIIRDNSQQRENGERNKNPRTSMKNTIAIFLGICALPLALPLAFTVIILFFAFMLVIAALILAAVMSVVAVFVTGIPLIVSGITNIGTPGNALVAFGGGLLSIGVALLLMLGLTSLIGYLIPAFSRTITKIYDKAKGGRRYEKA